MVRRALEVATPSCKFANAIFVSLRAIESGAIQLLAPPEAF